ncbi:hypothetical protein DESACE_00205 [Desulfurella acetivorans A63]|nr:hypothetical protein DESACE_00205 [Desulfurella acetivorans A63]
MAEESHTLKWYKVDPSLSLQDDYSFSPKKQKTKMHS